MDVDATAQGTGILCTADFQIRFQQFDNVIWPYDGRMFDNVDVIAQD